VADPSVPAVIETVDVALKSYFEAPPSEYKLTNLDGFHKAIKDLKFGMSREASYSANGISPCPDLQICPTYPSLPLFVEERSGDLYPQTGEGFGTTIILSTH
jgi:hypothetical protein